MIQTRGLIGVDAKPRTKLLCKIRIMSTRRMYYATLKRRKIKGRETRWEKVNFARGHCYQENTTGHRCKNVFSLVNAATATVNYRSNSGWRCNVASLSTIASVRMYCTPCRIVIVLTAKLTVPVNLTT